MRSKPGSLFFFFNDTATTEIYTLSLHDALPISLGNSEGRGDLTVRVAFDVEQHYRQAPPRSEEHTSELQSQSNLVCRLLLEKKKTLFPIPLSLSPFSLNSVLALLATRQSTSVSR